MKHMAEKRANGSETHIHCKFCGVNFATEEAEIFHIQEVTNSQILNCLSKNALAASVSDNN